MRTVFSAICVILFLRPLLANAERILILAVAPFMSHQLVQRSLSLALHKRGHEIVMLTPFPLRDPTLKNYTEIDVSNIIPIITEYNVERVQMSQMDSCRHALVINNKITTELFHISKFKEIYKRDSGEKFDAVIVEAVTDLALYAMAHRFNAPLIGIMSLGIHNYQRYIFGSPLLPSHPSNWEINTLIEGNPSFWQRVQNFIDVWSYIYYWTSNNVISQQQVAQKYLGSDTPHVMDIKKNMSILLVNENPVFTYVRPEPPNVIFFNGIHISKTPPSLPKDLKRFLDDATEGFIYVSLGTTITCSNLPKEIVSNFVEVFSELPYKIVWKFDCNDLPRKLDNAFISKWFPQQGVLAHPNIKLFIYQGGMQSSEEAVHYAVPVVGIPIMFEQASRIQRLTSLGVAVHLKLKELTKEDLNTAIFQVTNDKSYKERMTYLSELSKDQPYDSLENAIWWVEYVIRHKGINYLRFSECDKPWYQRYDMDIIAFLSTTLFIAACVKIFIMFRIFQALQRAF